MMKFKSSLLLASAVVAIAACGGGGGGNDMPPVQADPLDALPIEATQSVSGWVGFLDRLIKAANADVREGFGLSSIGVTSVPGDDAAEPTVLQ
jgi:ABC-type glycerol-3-phosphate transport system substrate-binding protein